MSYLTLALEIGRGAWSWGSIDYYSNHFRGCFGQEGATDVDNSHRDDTEPGGAMEAWGGGGDYGWHYMMRRPRPVSPPAAEMPCSVFPAGKKGLSSPPPILTPAKCFLREAWMRHRWARRGLHWAVG